MIPIEKQHEMILALFGDDYEKRLTVPDIVAGIGGKLSTGTVRTRLKELEGESYSGRLNFDYDWDRKTERVYGREYYLRREEG